MQRHRSLFLVSTTFLLLFSAQAQAQATMPDDGEVKDGVYYNSYFNLGFQPPKDWLIHDDALNKRVHERAKKEAADADTLRQLKHTYLLLSVSRYKPGTPGVAINPIIIVAAEQMPRGNLGAKEYLHSLRVVRTQRGMRALLNEPVEFRVAGLQFLRDDYSDEKDGVSMRQSIFVTIKKGYALIFSFSGADEKNVAEMARTMNTLLPLGRGGNKPLPEPERKPDLKN